ncbi:MAG: hypothetical protein J5I92_14975 [Thiogranum sp.]|nr:hypothetical protein [Thiogranum sp.]
MLLRGKQFLRVATPTLGACLWFAGSALADVTGTVLWYLHQEPGTEPYRVRYLVTRDYLRSDEGSGREGFVLLDRRSKQIYNVVPETRSVLQIDGKGTVPEAPAQLAIEVRETVDPQAPKLEGKSAVTLELLADRQLCYSAVVVPGLLDDVWPAFGEFQRVLAVQQQRTIQHTPEELRTSCFMANYLYATDFHLNSGIPLIEWDERQDRRELLSYEADVELQDALFELPAAYAVQRAPGN